MRLETIPIILAALIALCGLALLADAALPQGVVPRDERRRRRRTARRNRAGEGAIALGILLVAAAIAGRDAWRYSTLVVLVATILLLLGVALNWRYVRATFLREDPVGPGTEPTPRTAPGSAAETPTPPHPERRLNPR